MVANEPAIEISVEDLAGSLGLVLARIQREGVRFVVTDGGRSVATIASTTPTRGEREAAITLGQFVNRLKNAPRPDAVFEDDLETIQSSQQPLKQVA